MGRALRAISRTIRRQSGDAKAEVLKLTAQTGELLERSVAQARRLAAVARRKARGRRAQAKLKGAERCEKVAVQIKQRVAGEPIIDRIVTLFDPAARPIRKGKLGKPNEFRGRQPAGRGDREHQARCQGPDPASVERSGQPGGPRTRCCPAPWPSSIGSGSPRGKSRSMVASCPGRPPPRSRTFNPRRVFIAGRQEPGSKRSRRRLRRYRTGAEGRISHLKRRYGLDRSRLKGDEGRQSWTEWSILTYNAHTLAVRIR